LLDGSIHGDSQLAFSVSNDLLQHTRLRLLLCLDARKSFSDFRKHRSVLVDLGDLLGWCLCRKVL
jgi:hypothetical protein